VTTISTSRTQGCDVDDWDARFTTVLKPQSEQSAARAPVKFVSSDVPIGRSSICQTPPPDNHRVRRRYCSPFPGAEQRANPQLNINIIRSTQQAQRNTRREVPVAEQLIRKGVIRRAKAAEWLVGARRVYFEGRGLYFPYVVFRRLS
jgi:hypothetical protein